MSPAALAARPRLLNRHRLGRLGSFASTQVLVQALGFAAGLVLVRQMAQQDYGWFTLLLAAISTGGVLADLGLTMGAMAIGGRIGGRPGALDEVMHDAQRLLSRWLLLLLPALALGLGLLLHRQGAPAELVPWLAVMVAATVALNARSALALVLVRLLGQVRLQQQLDLGCNVLRLLLVLLLAWAAAHWLDAAGAALLGLGVAAVYVAVLNRCVARQAPAAARTGDDLHRAELLLAVRRQAPNSLYFVISSQVAVGLIALFGSANNVAEVGALGRLGALFTLIGAVTAALVLPYFAKRQDPGDIARGLAAVHLSFAALLCGLLALGLLAPAVLLWVLGPGYAGLHAELPWLLAACTLSAWGGTLYSAGCARGWVLPFAWSVPAGLLAMSAVALSVDLSTVRGVLAVNVAAAATSLLLVSIFLGRRVTQLRATAAPAA
jgi:hypothetical protein